ncbi:MAG: nucleotidyltransferase domain-containing protein [Clostridia bacterium]|nr:nucleotidyltransferase domain-containing protein [Clostridia bacterium]
MLKNVRQSANMTQEQFSKYLGIPLRTYKRYELNESLIPAIKREYILSKIKSFYCVDEDNGVLSQKQIKAICNKVFKKYPIDYCYLFGSYAKGKATDGSDVDLLVSTKLKGLKFFGLVEDLRLALNKRVDVLNVEQLKGNYELVTEILSEGIKIYG